MIIRATSDLHLSQASAPYVFAALEELRADAQATGGFTVLAGDIFDQPVSTHMPTWQRIRNLLLSFPGEGVYVLAGNHDIYDYPGGTCLGGLDGGSVGGIGGKVKVITTPTATRIGDMIPYTKGEGEFRDRWEGLVVPINLARPQIMWAHQGFRGAYQNAMRRDRDGTPCVDIPAKKIVVTGHYHMPQSLGRIVYCGSPYQTTFAEEGQHKGWLRWDDAMSNPIPKRIPYTFDSPIHYTVQWDGESVVPVPEGFRSGLDKVRYKVPHKVVDHMRQRLPPGATVLDSVKTSLGRLRADMAAARPKDAAYLYLQETEGIDVDVLSTFAEEEGLWG